MRCLKIFFSKDEGLTMSGSFFSSIFFGSGFFSSFFSSTFFSCGSPSAITNKYVKREDRGMEGVNQECETKKELNIKERKEKK